MKKEKSSPSEFIEKVISVDRISRTVKGGKRLRFRALVVVGNKKGKVGLGLDKAKEVLTAVKKAVNMAKKEMIEVSLVEGTIAHEVKMDYGSVKIFLKPARAGTSIIAGGAVRPVLELAGVKNILSKIYGTSNKINNAKATILALKSLRPLVKEKKQEDNANN